MKTWRVYGQCPCLYYLFDSYAIVFRYNWCFNYWLQFSTLFRVTQYGDDTIGRELTQLKLLVRVAVEPQPLKQLQTMLITINACTQYHTISAHMIRLIEIDTWHVINSCIHYLLATSAIKTCTLVVQQLITCTLTGSTAFAPILLSFHLIHR